MRKSARLFVAVLALMASGLCANAQKQKVTVKDGESIEFRTLPDGISSKGVAWPSWVITRNDTFQFLAFSMVEQQKQIGSLQYRANLNKKRVDSLRAQMADVRGNHDTLARNVNGLGNRLVADEDYYDKKMQINYLKIAKVDSELHALKGDVFQSALETNNKIDSIGYVHGQKIGILDRDLGQTENCVNTIRTHAKWKTPGRVRREEQQQNRIDQYEQYKAQKRYDDSVKASSQQQQQQGNKKDCHCGGTKNRWGFNSQSGPAKTMSQVYDEAVAKHKSIYGDALATTDKAMTYSMLRKSSLHTFAVNNLPSGENLYSNAIASNSSTMAFSSSLPKVNLLNMPSGYGGDCPNCKLPGYGKHHSAGEIIFKSVFVGIGVFLVTDIIYMSVHHTNDPGAIVVAMSGGPGGQPTQH